MAKKEDTMVLLCLLKKRSCMYSCGLQNKKSRVATLRRLEFNCWHDIFRSFGIWLAACSEKHRFYWTRCLSTPLLLYCRVFLQTEPRSFLYAIACNCWKETHMQGLPIPVNVVCCTRCGLVFRQAWNCTAQACLKTAQAVRVFLVFQCLIRP